MRQYHLDSAIARVTGESLHTIQQRGFGLVRMASDRSTRQVLESTTSSSHPGHAEYAADNVARRGSDC